jgi:molybdopterin-guanine dinucleotide biosynthesis protein A
MQITGIILAGGLSSRMGTDKALMKIGEKTLLENAVEICKPVCSSIIISSNKQAHKFKEYLLVKDEIPDCGPMGGIYSAIKKSKTNWNFVLSVDSPFVKSTFIKSLFSEKEGFNCVVPVHPIGKEPLIALYHKNVLPEIEGRIKVGENKLHDLFDALNPNFFDSQNWLVKYPNLFYNINRPEDFLAV